MNLKENEGRNIEAKKYREFFRKFIQGKRDRNTTQYIVSKDFTSVHLQQAL